MRNSSDLPMGDPSHSINVDNNGAVAVGRTGEILITAPGNVNVNNPHTTNQNTSCQSPSEIESHETKTTNLLLTLLSLVLALEYALRPPDNKDASKMQAWHICNGLTFFALIVLGIVAGLTWSDLRHYFTNSELPKNLLYLSGAMTIVGGITRLVLTHHISITSIGYATIILIGIIHFFALTWWFRNRATAHAMAALGPALATLGPALATLGPAAPTHMAPLGPVRATPAPAAAFPAPATLDPSAPTPSAGLGPAPAAPAPATPSNDLGPASATPAPNSLGPAAPTLPTTLSLQRPLQTRTLLARLPRTLLAWLPRALLSQLPQALLAQLSNDLGPAQATPAQNSFGPASPTLPTTWALPWPLQPHTLLARLPRTLLARLSAALGHATPALRQDLNLRRKGQPDEMAATNPVKTEQFQVKDQIGTFFYFPSLNFHGVNFHLTGRQQRWGAEFMALHGVYLI